MLKRGRKSSADLSTVTPLAGARAAAPDELTPEQAAIWTDTVCRLPADWFPRESHRLLAEYCKSATRAAFLGEAVDAFTTQWLAAEGGVERYGRLTTALGRQVAIMNSLARALRITNQSRLRPETAARKAVASPDGGPKPWEE